MSTPAFTPLSPSRLSPSPRRRVLKAARDRGWLLAPSLRQVTESSLAAFRAGTLPDVALLPVPSPSSTSQTSTPSFSPPKVSPSSSPHASTSHTASPSLTDSDDLDSLCRGFDTALRTANSKPNVITLPWSPRTPSPVRSEADSDDLDELALRTVSRRRAAARAETHSPNLDERALRSPKTRRTMVALPRSPHTPSPTRSEANSDDLDELALRTVTRRRIEATAVQSSPTGRSGSDNDDLDGLCRGLETALRFPHDVSGVYAPFDVDKENHILPALKGAGQWLGLAALPFDRVRERAADKLLAFFDREVLAGRLVKNAPPRERVTIAWSGRLTKTAGVTRMKRLACGRRTAAIELSVKVVDEPARLYNTLAHELCHAAAWIIDECCKPPHGEQFKNWAREFKLWDDRLVITTCHEYEIRYKFKYTCQGCGQVYGRHSRSIDTSKKVCGKCRGALHLVKEP